jgi:response regulator RpfG family c-di-GMP phosphodiesterase
LIVDDNPANLLAFQTVLEPGYTITLAQGGDEALRSVLQEDFAVILLDVRMPGLDGFEVAQALRRRDRTRHTPIIFTSAYDHTVVQAKKGYVAGATDFIFSPVDEDLLRLKVATYVEMYLRNESLMLRIADLETSVKALERDLAQYNPHESVWRKISILERQIVELRREITVVPS